MRHSVISRLSLATIWCIAWYGVALADEAEATADAARQEATDTAGLAADAAAAFRLASDARPNDRISLNGEPLLKWSNPSVGRVYGSVFVWTEAGRPAACASIYRWYSPYKAFTAEFVSLASGPFNAQFDSKDAWTPAEAGVTWHALPEAPPPAESPRGRNAQMREIAGQFSASLMDRRVDDKGTSVALRLLAKPLFQYDSGHGPGSGAVFAFVTATDPEILLLLEARPESDRRAWHYGLARMNRDELEVKHQDKRVWSVPAVDRPWENLKATYFTIELPRPEK